MVLMEASSLNHKPLEFYLDFKILSVFMLEFKLSEPLKVRRTRRLARAVSHVSVSPSTLANDSLLSLNKV